ncbi:MAG TPA: cardiolipin synthase [Curvibacter sp.]|nr:cardiolipin synthase [Curvibacter sp.]
MNTGHWISLHGLVALGALSLYLASTHTFRQRRHPSAAIAWLLSILLLPYLALPLYLLIGNRKFARPPQPQPTMGSSPASAGASAEQRAFQTLAWQMGLPPAVALGQFTLHRDGAHAYAALLALLDGASTSIDLSTFVLAHDALGQAVCERLAAKARAGLRVRLIVDGVGRYFGGSANFRALRGSGVQVSIFIPPFSSALPGQTNLRNHRKLVLVDGARLWTGGRNLSSFYFDRLDSKVPESQSWIDLTFEVDGPIAAQAQAQFECDWALATTQKISEARGSAPAPLLSAASQARCVQLIPSGPDQREDTVYTLLISACHRARERILAVTPYFVPDAALAMALSLAARRGIAVDLVLPKRSNHMLADLARMAALRDLHAVGVRIWLTHRMVHAKAIVFDEEISLAGTANLDERSLFLNFELMIAFYGRHEVRAFAEWIDDLRQKARAFDARAPSLPREMLEGTVRWLAFQL